MLKNNQGKIIVTVGVIVFIYIVISHNLSVNFKLQELRYEVKALQLVYKDVSHQLDTIVEMDNLVLNQQYKVEKVIKDDLILGNVIVEFTSKKLGSYEDLVIIYRKTFDSFKPINYDYSNAEWESVEIVNAKGTYSVEFNVAFSCDYELKIAYKYNDYINYEQLADLNLYTKAEYVFMKDINIYSIKKNKVKFDVQIAKLKSSDDVRLLSSICNIYYDDEIIEVVDILEENKIIDRKEPSRQMEHLDGDYWFVIKEIEFDDIKDFDKTKVKIELVLEDSIKNIYKMDRVID